MAKEHLVKARELIASGWVQADLKADVDGKTCYCLDGALAEAHGFNPENSGDSDIYGLLVTESALHEDVVRVFDVLPDASKASALDYINECKRDYASQPDTRDWFIKDTTVGALWKYNDRTETTQQDVLDVLDRAIEKAA